MSAKSFLHTMQLQITEIGPGGKHAFGQEKTGKTQGI